MFYLLCKTFYAQLRWFYFDHRFGVKGNRGKVDQVSSE